MMTGVLIFTVATIASGQFTGFQGFPWGTTHDEVVDELGPPIEDRGYAMLYQPDPDDRDYVIGFFFLNDGGLVMGRMMWIFNRFEARDAWLRMEDIKPVLESKYGEPFIDELVWSDSVRESSKRYFADDPVGAIEMQYGRWLTSWQVDNLNLGFMLYENDGYTLLLEYSDPEHETLYYEEDNVRRGTQF
jgi:hypothetical protein